MADDPLAVRVAGILDALESLTRMTPGMPVKAEDWNTVVGAIIDVARLVSTRALTAPPHTHPGQVARDWLDPTLSDFVDTTRREQQAQAVQIKELAMRLDRIEARFATLGDQVGTLQSLADQQADAALDRDIELKRMSERVDGYDVLGSQLTDLHTRLDALEPRIQDAAELRLELAGPNAALPDLGGLQAQVNDLDLLRENLRIGDGSLGRLRDLERRLDTFEALGTNEDAFVARVDEAVGESLAERGVDTDSISSLVDTRIAGAVDPLSETVSSLSGAARKLFAITDEQTDQLAGAAKRLDALEVVAKQTVELSSRIDALEKWCTSAKTTLAALRSDMDALLKLRDQVDSLEARLHEMGAILEDCVRREQFDAVMVELKDLIGRVEMLERRIEGLGGGEQLANVEATLKELMYQVKTLDGRVQLLEAQVADLRRITTAQLNTLDGRVSALQTTSSKLAVEIGGINERVGKLQRVGRVPNLGDG